MDDAINVLKDHAEGPIYPGHPLAHVVSLCFFFPVLMLLFHSQVPRLRIQRLLDLLVRKRRRVEGRPLRKLCQNLLQRRRVLDLIREFIVQFYLNGLN